MNPGNPKPLYVFFSLPVSLFQLHGYHLIAANLHTQNLSEKTSKKFHTRKSSVKLHFSLNQLIEKFNIFFSNLSGCATIAAFPSTLTTKN